ncbi:MAG: hypothetical protein JW827_06070 [Spirochaetes bacterium]|nr:hypothetical protein [Spirochaetota bacterium]
MNTFLTLIFLPAILWAGVSSTISDIKTGKVRNRLIKNGYLYGLVVYFVLFIWTVARKHSVFLAIHTGKSFYLTYHYYFDMMINAVLALTAGIILWKRHYWAAGDAKLYALLCFLVPLTVYSNEKILYFPSFLIMVNTYTLFLFYLIFTGIYRLIINKFSFAKLSKQIKKVPQSWHKWIQKVSLTKILNFINMIIIYLIAFNFISSLKFKINVGGVSLSSQLLIILCLFVVFRPLRKLLKKAEKISFIIFPVFVAVACFLWSHPSFQFNPMIRFTSTFFILMIILRISTSHTSEKEEIKKIKIDRLKPNMILGDKTIEFLKKEKKFFEKKIGCLYFDGLSAEQTETIKGYYKKKKLNKIEISRTFPFAPFIFAGAMVTLIHGGSLFVLINKLLR